MHSRNKSGPTLKQNIERILAECDLPPEAMGVLKSWHLAVILDAVRAGASPQLARCAVLDVAGEACPDSARSA